MSNFSSHRTRLILVIGMLIASACNFPSGAPTATPYSPDAIYTEAAQTVVTRLTQAPLMSPTPAGPGSSTEATLLPTETQAFPSTATPTPSKPTETVTPNPTMTVSAADPRLSLGTPTWQDTFSDSKNWSLSDDDHTKMEVHDGALSMTAKKAENWDGWAITWVTGKNFYLEMTAAPGDCSGLDHYGVVFRTNDDASEAYLFGLSCDGRYSFYLWDGKSFTRLIKWTPNAAILMGANQTNRMGVKADGDRFSFYANGVLLGDSQNTSFSEGHIGVFIGSANTANFTVRVDEMDFWESK